MGIIENQDYTKIYENGYCSIIFVKTLGAIKLFCSGAKWFINNVSAQEWKEYTKTNVFFILVSKETELRFAMIYDKRNTNYLIRNGIDGDFKDSSLLAVFNEIDTRVSNTLFYKDFHLYEKGDDAVGELGTGQTFNDTLSAYWDDIINSYS